MLSFSPDFEDWLGLRRHLDFPSLWKLDFGDHEAVNRLIDRVINCESSISTEISAWYSGENESFHEIIHYIPEDEMHRICKKRELWVSGERKSAKILSLIVRILYSCMISDVTRNLTASQRVDKMNKVMAWAAKDIQGTENEVTGWVDYKHGQLAELYQNFKPFVTWIVLNTRQIGNFKEIGKAFGHLTHYWIKVNNAGEKPYAECRFKFLSSVIQFSYMCLMRTKLEYEKETQYLIDNILEYCGLRFDISPLALLLLPNAMTGLTYMTPMNDFYLLTRSNLMGLKSFHRVGETGDHNVLLDVGVFDFKRVLYC